MRGRGLRIALAALLLAAAVAATGAQAGEQVANLAPGPAEAAASEISAQAAQDKLHRDPRWPRFRYCIQNTQTPQAFDTCLERAFQMNAAGKAAKADRERMPRKRLSVFARRNSNERGS